MNVISFLGLTALTVSLGAAVVSCGKSEKGVVSAGIGARQPLVPVVVEVRDDGLAYVPGEGKPFTGAAITLWHDAPWLVKFKEPYKEGKRDGDKLELFKNGKVKSLRRYAEGVPQYHALYHRNGNMKLEINLNAADKGEGPYQRWYEDGMLEAAASFDAQERWHNDFKEWTKTGELKTHHIFKHGLLEKIIFESPESAAARRAIGLEVAKPTETAR